ncbi:fungal-specific transcription factor domain-containing protein [Lentinula aciculospora]|uniref:Fungal-specific transcription factor domain-containing protein n=1 Tax=Lentinula aciculospora TaxID=153920 RepID=A0A9W9AC06_9AGAR|nr:fungal-specific transcription factor domain-containing protein [Lentinula aciculospora]KAJ4487624.1 fungal-specific transcription factor domain-containing protein [Lentinula aciculospora]
MLDYRSQSPYPFSAMPIPLYSYSSYRHTPSYHYSSSPYAEVLSLSSQDYDMSQDHSLPHLNQQPPSPSIPIDPSLALYPPYYHSYQQQPQQHLPSHLSIAPNYPSPSSQGSDTIGTPPTEHTYPGGSSSNVNGKRPASAISTASGSEAVKKARKGDGSPEVRSPTAEKEEKPKPTRGSRACTVCRRLKMKCIGAEQGPPCKRCQTGGHECIFEESNRGKRSSKKHELLTRSLRKMERTLDTVLRSIGNPSIASGMISRSPSPNAQNLSTQALLNRSPSPSGVAGSGGSPKLHSLPDNALNPLGLLAEASLANRRAQVGTSSSFRARADSPGENPKIGVASDIYFKPGPMTILPLRRLYIERQVQPEMLSFVSTQEVVALFKIFFDHINMQSNLLDRNFHTPSLVCSRSPFLLTTMCAIASKFFTEKPDLHPRLTELSKKLAFSVPAKGYKSVEIVQAYILLTMWGLGAVERYEQDKTWLLLGMAIRMATDLNLHRKTAVNSQDTQEGRARDLEVHNRERTWILCFCLDRSHSALLGKPHTIKEDFIIRNADIWCKSSVAISSDRSIAAYAELQRILSRSLDFLYSKTDSASGLQTSCDYLLVIKTFESQIIESSTRWMRGDTLVTNNPATTEYRAHISQFYLNYVLLVLNSFGLQNALERSPMDMGHFFARCHSCATTCAMLVRDRLGPSGFLKYSPDSHFVQTSYAVLTLLKLIRPEFTAYLDNEQSTIVLIKDVADVLESNSVNPTHTPALYSTFLKALISARLERPSEEKTSSSDVLNGDTGSAGHQVHFQDADTIYPLNEFQFEGEMGPVADVTTFPPTMAPDPMEDSVSGMTMDSIFSSNFWDSVLVPGYNSLDGLTGGFVFGAGGSGLITPHIGLTPTPSGQNTPSRGLGSQDDLAMTLSGFDQQEAVS